MGLTKTVYLDELRISNIARVRDLTPAFQVNVELNPLEVKPNNRTTVTATVTDTSGSPISGHGISLSASAVLYSGGHQHDGNRPVGTFSNSSGNTGSDGKFTTTYTATAFGGQERITAKSEQYPIIIDTEILNVRIPGLVELTSGANYILDGQTPIHPNNHFGIPKVADSLAGHLVVLANAYATKYPGEKLEYNDISLSLGGGFDINGNWVVDITNPNIGHLGHRLGREVDMQVYPNTDPQTLPRKKRKMLKYFVNSLHPRVILPHRGHWHIGFLS